MEELTHWGLALLAGMVAVWLLAALVVWRAQCALPPAQGQARYFHLSSSLWWMGPMLVFLGPGLLLLLLFLVPVGDKDVLPMAFIALFLGGISPVMGVMLMRARFRADAAGLTGYSVWGLSAFVAWSQIKRITFSAATQSLRFDDGARPVYVLVQLHEWPNFVTEIEQRLPHLALPAEIRPEHALRHDGAQLAIEGHWQGMYDHASRIFWSAALVVGVSLLFLEPHPPALFWSALGGVGLALYPLVRRLVPKPRKHPALIGNLIQAGGMAMFVPFSLRAQGLHTDWLGGEDALTAEQFLALLAQTLGMSVLSAATLILLAKWRWPQRFARERMGKDDWGVI